LRRSNELLKGTNELLDGANELLDGGNELLRRSNELLGAGNEPLRCSNEPWDRRNELVDVSNEPLRGSNESSRPMLDAVAGEIRTLSPMKSPIKLLSLVVRATVLLLTGSAVRSHATVADDTVLWRYPADGLYSVRDASRQSRMVRCCRAAPLRIEAGPLQSEDATLRGHASIPRARRARG